jgi:hypothetical protein
VLANWETNRLRKNAGEVVPNENYLGVGHFDLMRLWSQRRDEVAPWWSVNRSTDSRRCVGDNSAVCGALSPKPTQKSTKRRMGGQHRNSGPELPAG